MQIQTLTAAEVRERHVAQWGEAKVRENDLDVLRRFGRNAPADLLARYTPTTTAL